MEDIREGMMDVREGIVDVREGKEEVRDGMEEIRGGMEEVREGMEEDRQIGMGCPGLVIDTAIPGLFCAPFLPVGVSYQLRVRMSSWEEEQVQTDCTHSMSCS